MITLLLMCILVVDMGILDVCVQLLGPSTKFHDLTTQSTSRSAAVWRFRRILSNCLCDRLVSVLFTLPSHIHMGNDKSTFAWWHEASQDFPELA